MKKQIRRNIPELVTSRLRTNPRSKRTVIVTEREKGHYKWICLVQVSVRIVQTPLLIFFLLFFNFIIWACDCHGDSFWRLTRTFFFLKINKFILFFLRNSNKKEVEGINQITLFLIFFFFFFAFRFIFFTI